LRTFAWELVDVTLIISLFVMSNVELVNLWLKKTTSGSFLQRQTI